MGHDPEFGRGTSIYQRHLGDADHRPNPCVAPIEQAPFYALRIYPADLGTAIGLRTDCHARVLRKDGTAIAGLYACGNDMGSIMNGNYPGPGITLGPALTFGYIAGRHLAQADSDARAQRRGRA
jgi:predicted oxidoreductase